MQHLPDSDRESENSCWGCCTKGCLPGRNRQERQEEEGWHDLIGRMLEEETQKEQQVKMEARDREMHRRLDKVARKYELKREKEEEMEKEVQTIKQAVLQEWARTTSQQTWRLTEEEVQELQRLQKQRQTLQLKIQRLEAKEAKAWSSMESEDMSEDETGQEQELERVRQQRELIVSKIKSLEAKERMERSRQLTVEDLPKTLETTGNRDREGRREVKERELERQRDNLRYEERMRELERQRDTLKYAEVHSEMERLADLERHQMRMREMVNLSEAERNQMRMRDLERMSETETSEESDLEEYWIRLKEMKKKKEYERQKELKKLGEGISQMELEREEGEERQMQGQFQLEMQLADMEEKFAKEREIDQKRHKDSLRELESKSKIERETKMREMERNFEKERVMAQRRGEELLQLFGQMQQQCQDMGREKEREIHTSIREQMENTERRMENEHENEMQREQERKLEMKEQLKEVEQKFEMEKKRQEEIWREIEKKRLKQWEEKTRELERELVAEQEAAQQREQELLKLRKEQKVKMEELANTEKQKETKREEKITSVVETSRKTALEKETNKGKEWMREIKQKLETNKDAQIALQEQQISHKQIQVTEKTLQNEEKMAEEMDWLSEMKQKGGKNKDIDQQEEQIFLDTPKREAEKPETKPVTRNDKSVAQEMDWLSEVRPKQEKLVDSGITIKEERRPRRPRTGNLIEENGKAEQKHVEQRDDWFGDLGLKTGEDKWSEIRKRHQESREKSRQELENEFDKGEQSETIKSTVVRAGRRCGAKIDADEKSLMEVNKQDKLVYSEITIKEERRARRPRTGNLIQEKKEPEQKNVEQEDDWFGDLGIKTGEDKWSEITKRHQESREKSRQELEKQFDEGEQSETIKSTVVRAGRRCGAKIDADEKSLMEMNKQEIREVKTPQDEGTACLEEIKKTVKVKRESLEKGLQIMDEEPVLQKKQISVEKTTRERVGKREMKQQHIDGYLDEWFGNTDKSVEKERSNEEGSNELRQIHQRMNIQKETERQRELEQGLEKVLTVNEQSEKACQQDHKQRLQQQQREAQEREKQKEREAQSELEKQSKLRRQREMESEREAERKMEREKEAERQSKDRQKQIEMERQLEMKKRELERQREMEREKEIERQKQEKMRKIEVERQLEIRKQKALEREWEMEREKEAERQKEQDKQRKIEMERQLETQKQRELERQREMEREKEAQKELDKEKQKELERQRTTLREKEFEEQKRQNDREKQDLGHQRVAAKTQIQEIYKPMEVTKQKSDVNIPRALYLPIVQSTRDQKPKHHEKSNNYQRSPKSPPDIDPTLSTDYPKPTQQIQDPKQVDDTFTSSAYATVSERVEQTSVKSGNMGHWSQAEEDNEQLSKGSRTPQSFSSDLLSNGSWIPPNQRDEDEQTDSTSLTLGDEAGSFTESDDAGTESGAVTNSKSVGRKVLGWVNKKAKNYYQKKIQRTYEREEKEGNNTYMQWYMEGPISRATREQHKRESLMMIEDKRQKCEDVLRQWETTRAEKKEKARVKKQEKREKKRAKKEQKKQAKDEIEDRIRQRYTDKKKCCNE